MRFHLRFPQKKPISASPNRNIMHCVPFGFFFWFFIGFVSSNFPFPLCIVQFVIRFVSFDISRSLFMVVLLKEPAVRPKGVQYHKNAVQKHYLWVVHQVSMRMLKIEISCNQYGELFCTQPDWAGHLKWKSVSKQNKKP